MAQTFDEWLTTAKPGDTYDWFAETKNPRNKGVVSVFSNQNAEGKPIVQTQISEERSNWRRAIEGEETATGSRKVLENLGYDPAMARFLTSRQLGWSSVLEEEGSSAQLAQPIGTLADGTKIYGWDAKGNPVTSPNGTIYSTLSSTDAIAKANAGTAPLGTGSSATEIGATGMTDTDFRERKSAYDLLYQQFQEYGLQSLVEPLKGLVMENISPSEFTIRLRETEAYKKRFAANQQRIAKGLRALSEAEYIGLEDQYQNVMRNYGLPASYYTRGDMGRQEGFERFIAGDVSAVELEDRIQTAQNRVINAAPEISATLKQFYPDLSTGDILAYVLDPEKAITDIKRKVTAAEIGGAATMAGLATGAARAEELARYGVTAESARQGFQTIADIAPRGSQLAEIYKQSPYTQTTAEQEVFGLSGATEAATRRKKLQQLEQASFSGSAGIAGGALARDRAGAF